MDPVLIVIGWVFLGTLTLATIWGAVALTVALILGHMIRIAETIEGDSPWE